MNIIEHAPALLIAVPLLTAFGLYIISKISLKLAGIVIVVSLLIIAVLGVAFATDVFHNGTRVYVMGAQTPGITLPTGKTFPIRIILEPDAMSALMVLLVIFIGIAGFIYSFQCESISDAPEQFHTLLMLLLAGMLGLVMTGDLFNFFVFFEITSIAACGLIGFRVSEPVSSIAAFRTMTIYTLGGLMLLLGVGVIYGKYGALNIAYVAKQIDFDHVDKLALALFIGSLLMKIGAVPSHMWVPDAYGESPAPSTVVLVANTQIGLYALLRFCFTLYRAQNFAHIGWLLAIIGVITMVVGVLTAIYQNDLKRLIAYTAVAQTGYMLTAIGAGIAMGADSPFGNSAMTGGIFHIVNDVVSMGLIFMCAGLVYRSTGLRNMNELGGLGNSMKWVAALFLIGGFAVTGFPPFNGFASKIIIYQSVFKLNPVFSALALLSSLILLGVYVRAFYSIFLGSRMVESTPAPRGMVFATSMLALAVVVIGVLPNLVLQNLIVPAVDALKNHADYIGKIVGGGM